MCFGSSSKGEDPSSHLPAPRIAAESSKPQRNSIKMPQRETYAPPSGPPPSHQQSYDAPPGPPPSHQQSYAYEAPPGPPPSHSQSAEEYAPPPGPPPNFYSNDYAAPPPGPPPSHDWQSAVPDTSLLPPPPSLGNQRSSTNNATEQEAEQGESWCQQNPLRAPLSLPYDVLQAQVVQALQRGDIGIIKPRAYNGSLERARAGVWTGKTKSNSPDSCITSTIPLYSVQAHSPLTTRISKTIYYEVRIARNNRREVSLALGFAAPPYPTFRLPGWHRGCFAVHGDDGSKFINDRWGGKDFTQPFKAGQTLGVGMTFTARDVNAPPAYSDGPSKPQTSVQTPIDVEIFFTRDGRKDGGWNLHEEGDAVEDLPVTGLEGFHDLYAAVGTFEAVDFEIVFNEREWMYHP